MVLFVLASHLARPSHASPRKKSYDQPRQHIKKQRHYFANKGLSSQRQKPSKNRLSTAFPVVMWSWMWELDHKESWLPKNWSFWTVVLKKTLESPLDCKEIKPVNPEYSNFLKEINREYSLEGLLLKLKPQYFGHLMWTNNSSEKTLMLGKIEGRRRRGQQRIDVWMASPTQWPWVGVNSGRWWRTEKLL